MDSPDARGFRDVLGRFATGVVVVAALHDGRPVGFSVNSFTSLSLEPPLVLFCVALESTTWPKIAAGGRFALSILGEGQEDLCRRFATRHAERFHGVDWTQAPSGAPIIADAMAWLDCSTEQVYPGGDHEVVIGRVSSMGIEGHKRRPLVFFRGSYHRLDA